MYLSELKQIALENGENKSTVTRTLDTLRRSSIQYILEPKYSIRRSHNFRHGGFSIHPDDHELYKNLRRDIELGKADVTIDEILEEWPEPYDRLKLHNFGPQAEAFFMYLLEKYYQPSRDPYASRDTWGYGEYDI